MKQILNTVKELIKLPEDEIRRLIAEKIKSNIHIYPDSINEAGECLISVASDRKSKFLLVFSEKKRGLIANFSGELYDDSGIFAKKSPFSNENAVQLRKLFPWTSPVSLRKKKSTIGCGDRLGRATPGHISAVRKFDVSPVLAQQSIRELSLTGRTYENVIDDVSFFVYQEAFKEDFGADANHLKRIEEAEKAIDAGFTMLTLDLSEHINANFASFTKTEIDTAFQNLPEEQKERAKETYFSRNVIAGSLNFTISDLDAKRCVLMYGKAINFVSDLWQKIRKKKIDCIDLEISIDETAYPTKLEDHFFIINELTARNVDFISVAPRFVGEFQKGIDYIGDVNIFDEQFGMHCELARNYGNYKISIHSGSDKFSVFPSIGKFSKSKLHIKTAGTSWLEALRVISIKNPNLYRMIHTKALDSFEEAKKFYHVTTNLSKIKRLDTVTDSELSDYLTQNESRQVLHITYGQVLADKDLRKRLFSSLDENENFYTQKLDEHFTKHLSELGIKRRYHN